MTDTSDTSNHPHAPATLQQVMNCLTEVTKIERDDSTWRTGTLQLPHGGIFGGELLGQTVAVAAAINPEMTVKSVSAAFPRGVRDTGLLDYTVTSLHQGNAYATHRIDVAQPNRSGEMATAYVHDFPRTGSGKIREVDLGAGLRN